MGHRGRLAGHPGIRIQRQLAPSVHGRDSFLKSSQSRLPGTLLPRHLPERETILSFELRRGRETRTWSFLKLGTERAGTGWIARLIQVQPRKEYPRPEIFSFKRLKKRGAGHPESPAQDSGPSSRLILAKRTARVRASLFTPSSLGVTAFGNSKPTTTSPSWKK